MKAVNVCLSLSPGLSLDQSRGPQNFNECFSCLTLLNRGILKSEKEVKQPKEHTKYLCKVQSVTFMSLLKNKVTKLSRIELIFDSFLHEISLIP